MNRSKASFVTRNRKSDTLKMSGVDTFIQLSNQLNALRANPDVKYAQQLLGWIESGGLDTLRPSLEKFLEQKSKSFTPLPPRAGSALPPLAIGPILPAQAAAPATSQSVPSVAPIARPSRQAPLTSSFPPRPIVPELHGGVLPDLPPYGQS